MRDRLVRGSVAGLVAGIVMNALSFFLIKLLNFDDDLLIDYAGEMLFGSAPATFAESAIALFAHLIWTVFLGVLFAYLLLLIGSEHIVYKGWLYSVTTWFLTYAVGIMFEVPLLKVNTAATTATNIITGTAYGLLLGLIMQRLDTRAKIKNS